MCIGEALPHLKNKRPVWRKGVMERRREEEEEEECKKEKKNQIGRKRDWVSVSVTPSARQPQTHKEWDWSRKRGRDGEEVGGSIGAYENDHGWRQSLIRRKPWVFVVAGNGSSCLNNTFCLSRGVGLSSFTACVVSISDDSMDWLTGQLIFLFSPTNSQLSNAQFRAIWTCAYSITSKRKKNNGGEIHILCKNEF